MSISVGVGVGIPDVQTLIGGPVAGADNLLLETGDALLLETGDALLLE
jgi:hypothetical protein